MQPMTHEKLEEAVTALAEGRFEALTPDQMAEVEAHVNTCDSCAARLAMAPAVADRELAGDVETPPAEVWGDVWRRIDETAVRAEVPRPARGWARRWRAWAPVSIAAALLVAVGLTQLVPDRGGSLTALLPAGSGDVEIVDLKVFGDATPFVVSAGSQDEISVIWVIEDSEDT